MSAEVKLYRPEVKVTGLGKLGDSVSSVAITSGINSLPEILLGIHSSDGAASQAKLPLSKEELAAFREFQTAQIAGTSPQQGVSVSIKDVGPTGAFSAEYTDLVTVSPAFSIQDAYFDKGVKLMDGTVKLSRMAPSIYASVPIPPGADRGDRLEADAAEKEIEPGMNFMDMYVAILKMRMERYEKLSKTDAWADKATAEYARSLHAQNVKYFPMLEQIRKDSESEATYLQLKSLLSGNESEALILKSLGDFMSNEVLTPSDDFFGGFLSFLGNTQSFYAPPDAQYKHGRVRPFRAIADPTIGDGFDFKTHTMCSYVAFTSTLQKADTITSVLVQGVPITNNGTITNAETFLDLPFATQSTLYWLQNGSEDGVVANAPFIPWLAEKGIMDSMQFENEEEAATPLYGALYLNIQKARANRSKKNFREDYKKILEEYTQNFLGNMQLAPYTMALKVPLQFHWKPGYRYRVQALQGDSMITFNGFLNNLRHSIELTQNPQCSTLLQFSHVLLE